MSDYKRTETFVIQFNDVESWKKIYGSLINGKLDVDGFFVTKAATGDLIEEHDVLGDYVYPILTNSGDKISNDIAERCAKILNID